MEVREMKRGDVFFFTDPWKPNDVYEYKGTEENEHRIIRIAFRMDGCWFVDRSNGAERCNPFATVQLVALTFENIPF